MAILIHKCVNIISYNLHELTHSILLWEPSQPTSQTTTQPPNPTQHHQHHNTSFLMWGLTIKTFWTELNCVTQLQYILVLYQLVLKILPALLRFRNLRLESYTCGHLFSVKLFWIANQWNWKIYALGFDQIKYAKN